MNAFFALMERDVRVALRNAGMILFANLSQTIFVAIVFAVFFPRLHMVSDLFGTFVFPGLIAITILMNGVNGVLFPLSDDLSGTREIDERLLAPISVSAVAVEKIVIGTVTAVFSGLATVPIMLFLMQGNAQIHMAWAAFVPVLILCSTLSSAFAMTLGCLTGGRFGGFVFDAVIGPMILFGCAYYPWERLQVIGVFRYLFLLNPLVYMSEGVRAVMTPQVPHLETTGLLSGLIGSTVFFTVTAIWAFRWRTVL